MTPVDLLAEIIAENTPKSIWTGSPLEGYRSLGNTNRGEIGEEFVRRFLEGRGIPVEKDARTARTDMVVAGRSFEVKTASLGANGTFQFNHVRLDRDYRYLLCLGICPREVVFNLWRKGEVAEGEAGPLVRMAEGQAVTTKITKKLSEMHPINQLPNKVRRLVGISHISG